jgi:iron(III) transport system ATP-binding protein
VSIRQHQIGLMARASEAPAGNVVPATVCRQVFLGSSRDYTVALADNSELRVTAPADQSIAPGADVWLHLPAERCRALVGG